MMELLIQLVTAFIGTTCFAHLFHVANRHLWCCGLTGTIGWLVYWGMKEYQPSAVIASLVAVIPLALAARIFAVTRKAPVTTFLIPGIFPLVPGAGIYYTAYSFITGDSAGFTQKGTETLKIAVALAMGIALVMSIPMKQKRRMQRYLKQKQ